MKKIPYSELQFKASLAQGPGGQNVNKTMSAVQLWWNPLQSSVLTDFEKGLVARKATLTNNNEVTIRCDQFRDFERNKDAAIKILHDKLAAWLHVPKKRVATKPKKSAVRKRINDKKIDGEKKQSRRRIRDFE